MGVSLLTSIAWWNVLGFVASGWSPQGSDRDPARDMLRKEDIHEARNNSTHISWPKNECMYWVEPRNQTERDCLQFLNTHMMPFDVANAESLGFPPRNGENLPDGLSNGIVGPSIGLALDAKRDYHVWTKKVPKDVYFEYVANFASVNEPRTNWRPLFHQALAPIVAPLASDENTQVETVVDVINDQVWGAFRQWVDTGKGDIRFEPGQTPLIYDPMSVILFGYASCTGISIFLINALRTVGIPARLAGTDAWNGDVENGNHSWLEVWIDHQWYILEAKPAAGGLVQDWRRHPCQFWFCNPTKAANTTFYAARLAAHSVNPSEPKKQVLSRQIQEQPIFPLAWDRDNKGIPGEDRTHFMKYICSKC